LLLGIQEYQSIFNLWFPHRFKRVNIHCAYRENGDTAQAKREVGCAFSGGVDSFYTLWRHLPQNDCNPSSRVSYALFAHGFDIPLEAEESFADARNCYEAVLTALGVRLMTARVNIQRFVPRADWGIFHGPALIGAALVLGRLLKRFYVPASHTYTDLMPWGSDPRIDHLLSSDTLEIVHDGASVTRVAKTAIAAEWPATYATLRVCSNGEHALRNCCRCEKCLRTMITLDMLGALSRYVSFPVPLTRRAVRRCWYRHASDFAFARELMQYAERVGRAETAVDLRCAIVCSHLLNTVLRLTKAAIKAKTRSLLKMHRLLNKGRFLVQRLRFRGTAL
jgi:hypothetical protein